MIEDFDHIASSYDQTFTHTAIGKAQRDLVWAVLDELIPSFNGLDVLELNCGTGEDAERMGRLNAKVVATDISKSMVAATRNKTAALENVTSEVLDIKRLDNWENNIAFDLIFSNFGGLNCLSTNELKMFLSNAQRRLKTGGKLVLVIMPRTCLWETGYFISKFKFGKAFRRIHRRGVLANVENLQVRTYYHNPFDVQYAVDGYLLIRKAAIGLFIPPSYLESFFKKRPEKLKKLIKKDQNLIKKGLFSNFSDHYLICLEKC